MENYLTGRTDSGHPALEDESNNAFRSYLEQESVTSSNAASDSSEQNNLPVNSPADAGETALLYEEDGGPKVEVVSIDGRPVQIVVHLESGRILELNCEY